MLNFSVCQGHAGHENSPQITNEEKMSKEGEPSDTLWIGFPPPSKVDEEGLRRAFLLLVKWRGSQHFQTGVTALFNLEMLMRLHERKMDFRVDFLMIRGF